jgi:small ligand-binding sensory domain FIST
MNMRFASSITSNGTLSEAFAELLTPLDQRVTLGMVDLAILFVTAHFEDDLPEIVEAVGTKMPGAAFLGCTAEGTIGLNQELEGMPSMSLLVASLPGVRVAPFHLTEEELAAAESAMDWERIVSVLPESDPTFIALADPFRFAIHEFVERINETYPGAPLFGGVASAGRMPGENRLIVGDAIHTEGAVGVALTGNLTVEPVVSQGCRPIGKPFVVTKGERNVIVELGGLPPLAQLHDVLVGLSEDEEKLARESLFVGRVIDEHKEQFLRGDFLIHNIMGVDRKSGALAMAGHARVGATVQFHVRDAASADEDLRKLLAAHAETSVAGAVIFGCNGRGTNMWPQAGHDAGVLREVLGDIPVAGCFCGGEFGPVGGKNFIHGFTASIALFKQRQVDAAQGEI